MKHVLPKMGLLGATLAITGVSKAQPPQLPDPLYAEDFEKGLGTWIGLGESAKVAAEAAQENIKGGMNSLRFDYSIVPGQINLLATPVTPPSLATMKSIAFWVKANRNTSLAFVVQEQNGGRFGTIFSVPKDEWQRVEISPSELVLQTDKNDPEDQNGQLDTDKIESCALVDFGQVAAMAATDPDSPLVRMLGIETGPRTIYLDDLVLTNKPLIENPPDKEIIDDFSHPQPNWFTVGSVGLKVVKDAQPENNALQVDYTQAAGKLTAFAKLLPFGTLTGKTSLSFSVASKRHATLIVQLEERSGGKYNAVVDVVGDGTPSSKTIKFSDFKPAEDSKDNNNHLDLESVKQMIIIDASGMLGADTGANTLWVNQVRVK